jgi:hypothetical protein
MTGFAITEAKGTRLLHRQFLGSKEVHYHQPDRAVSASRWSYGYV